MKIKSEETVAKDRKLKITWSIEVQQDLRAFHNIEAAEVLLKMIVDEVDKLETQEYNQEAASYPNTEEQRKGVSLILQKYPWLRKQATLK